MPANSGPLEAFPPWFWARVRLLKRTAAKSYVPIGELVYGRPTLCGHRFKLFGLTQNGNHDSRGACCGRHWQAQQSDLETSESKKMKISAMDYSFSRGIRVEKIDTPAIIRYLKQLDVPGVEFVEAFVADQDLDSIRSALSETGTDVVAYLTYCNFIDPDPAGRQARVSQLRESLGRAAALGAPHCNGRTGYAGGRYFTRSCPGLD